MDDSLDQSSRIVEAHYNSARFGNDMDAFDDFLQHITPPTSPARQVKIFLTKAVDVVNNDDDDNNSFLSDDSDDSFIVKPKSRSRPEINRKHSGDLEKLFRAPAVDKSGVNCFGATEAKPSSQKSQTKSSEDTSCEIASSAKKHEQPRRAKSLTRGGGSSRCLREEELAVGRHPSARSFSRNSKKDELSGSDHLSSRTRGNSKDRRGAARKNIPSDLALESFIKVSRVSSGIIPRSGSGVSLSSSGKGDDLSTSRQRRAVRKDKPDDLDLYGCKSSSSRVTKHIPRSGSGPSISSAGRGDDLSAGMSRVSKKLARSGSGPSLSSAGRGDDLSTGMSRISKRLPKSGSGASLSSAGRRASRKEQADNLELSILKHSGSRVSKTIPRSGSAGSVLSFAMADELSSSRHGGRRASRKDKVEDLESILNEWVSQTVHRSGSDVSQSTASRSDHLSSSRHGRRASRKDKAEDLEVPQEKNSKTIPKSASGTSLSSSGSMRERSRQPVRKSEILEPGQSGRHRSLSRRRRQLQRLSPKEDDTGVIGTRRALKSSETDMSSTMRRTRSTADAVLTLRRDRLGARCKDTVGPLSHMRRCESTSDARLAGLSSTPKKGILKRDIDDILFNKRMGSKASTVSHTRNAQWNLTSMTDDATPTMLKLVF